MKLRNKFIIATSILAATTLTSILLFALKKIDTTSQARIVFDGQGGKLEIYNKEKISTPFVKGTLWSDFFKENDFIGSVKNGYDFLYWSIDGKEPISDNYVINQPITLKPVYVKNRDCVTFTCRAFVPGASAQLVCSNPIDDAEVYYSVNGGAFKPYTSGTKIQFNSVKDYVSFKTTGLFKHINCGEAYMYTGSKTAISGDLSALCGHKELTDVDTGENAMFYNFSGSNYDISSARGLDFSKVKIKKYCFSNMFFGSSIIIAPELPTEELAEGCYESMFEESSLKQGPSVLPAKEVPPSAYKNMFSMSEIVKAPDLLATTLSSKCYENMFYFCSSLKMIKISYTGLFNDDYFENWVQNVNKEGNFYYNGTDTTRGYSAIPNNWAVHTF